MTIESRARGTAHAGEVARISAIRERAGAFCCSGYAEQLLRIPGRRLGTVRGKIDRCVELLRKAEDYGVYVGQAVRYCLTRLAPVDEKAEKSEFQPLYDILAAAEEARESVEYWLREAILTQLMTQPEAMHVTALVAAAERPETVEGEHVELVIQVAPIRAPVRRLKRAA